MTDSQRPPPKPKLDSIPPREEQASSHSMRVRMPSTRPDARAEPHDPPYSPMDEVFLTPRKIVLAAPRLPNIEPATALADRPAEVPLESPGAPSMRSMPAAKPIASISPSQPPRPSVPPPAESNSSVPLHAPRASVPPPESRSSVPVMQTGSMDFRNIHFNEDEGNAHPPIELAEPERPSSSPLAASCAKPPSLPPPGPSTVLPVGPRRTANEERDGLAEFTRQFVQTMNRVSYYDAGHPAHHIVPDELYAFLIKALADQPQVGYLLQRGTTPEIFVDGLSTGRVKLADVVTGLVYDVFASRFIDYFDRHSLVLLAFRNGLSKEEFRRFVIILSQPSQAQRSGELPSRLLEERIFHVSAVIREDLGREEDGDLPWQVAVCLARLRRDLRLVPMFKGQGHDALARAKAQVFADTVRPIQSIELIESFIVQAERIERETASIEGLEDLQITAALVRALALKPLLALTERMVANSSNLSQERWRYVLDLCARRISRESPGEAVLRLLARRDLLAMDELSPDLQDWARAEDLFERRHVNALDALPLQGLRDASVLGKVARLAYDAGELDKTAVLAERLAAIAHPGTAKALNDLFGVEDLAEIGRRCDRSEDTAESGFCARLLTATGVRGARALAERIVEAGEGAHRGRAFSLLGRLPSAAEVLPDLLARDDLAPMAVRLLLSVASNQASSGLLGATSRWASHADPSVRLAALVAVVAQSGHVFQLLRGALTDPSPEVQALGLRLLSERFGHAESLRRYAMDILSKATSSSLPELLLTAIGLLARSPGPVAERDAVIAALQRVHDAYVGQPGFLGLGKPSGGRPDVVQAAKRAIAVVQSAAAAPPAGSIPPPADVEAPAPVAKQSFFERLLRGGSD